jgi:hypothetical protein
VTLPVNLTLPAVATHPGAHIQIGGVDLTKAVRAITIHGGIDEITTVTLDLIVLDGTRIDTEARVLIPADTEAALHALGWAPPGTVQLAQELLHAVQVASDNDTTPDIERWPPVYDAADELREHLDTEGPTR